MDRPVSHRIAPDRPPVNVSSVERAASLAGGGLLTWYGLQRRNVSGGALALAGAALLWHGASGRSAVYRRLGVNTARGVRRGHIDVHKTLTVRRPPQEVYAAWRRLEDLPRFMRHLQSVSELEDGLSRWRVAIPGTGRHIEWQARLEEDRPGEAIRWAATEHSPVQNRGAVEFKPAPGERGTELRVHIEYRPPAGQAGLVLAELANPLTADTVADEISHFKQWLETGEVPTIEGQPSCRR